jgi:maltose alpha-D-glucosyltransferase/alpha-amylase
MTYVIPRCRLLRPPDGAALLAALAEIAPGLGDYLVAQRWFGSKGRTVGTVTIVDGAAVPAPGIAAALALLEVAYVKGPPEVYLLPLAARPMADAEARLEPPLPALARLGVPGGDWLLYDGLEDPAVGEALLRLMEEADRLATAAGALLFDRTPVLSQAAAGVHPVPLRHIRRLRGEQSNTSVAFDDRLLLKVYRRLAAGENPDLEVSRFLTLKGRFRHIPLLAGFAEYAGADARRTVAVLQTFIPNQGDGWAWTLGALREFYAAARPRAVPGTSEHTLAVVVGLTPEYMAGARRLGEVTGELHAALASDAGDPAFAPEPVVPEDLRAWAAAIEAEIDEALAGLRTAGDRAAHAQRPGIDRILAAAGTVREKVARAIGRVAGVPLWKTRIHGDYHLGQVLRRAGAGDEFVITDFEGEPARPLAARRAKHSPLRDVAGMLRSFTYASYAGFFEAVAEHRDAARTLEPWRAAWETAAADAFLAGYRAVTVERGVVIVPPARDVMARLLSIFCLEKAAYELSYELNNRPAWLPIPLAAFTRELAA